MNRHCLPALASLLCIAAIPAVASDYVWTTDGASGYALDPALWLVNGAATETAPVAGTDTLKVEGTSATFIGGASGEANVAIIAMPHTEVLSGGQLLFSANAEKTFDFAARGVAVQRDGRLTVAGGLFSTKNAPLALSQGQSADEHPEVVVTGPNASYTSCADTAGQHVNNNIQLWDKFPTFIVESGAIISNASLISWATNPRFIVRGDGTRTVQTSVEFHNNGGCKSGEIWFGNGAVIGSGNFIVGEGGRIILDDADLSGNPVLRTSAAGATVDLQSGNCGGGRFFVSGSESAFFATNAVNATVREISLADGVATNVSALVSGGSTLRFSGGESIVGRNAKANHSLLRIAGEGTDVTFEWTGNNMHQNSSLLCLGYTAPNGVSTDTDLPQDNIGHAVEVLDGARLSLVKSASSEANANNNGLVLGKSSACIGARFLVGRGAWVTNAFYTYVGGMHDTWGGGSCGELVVSNGTFVAGNDVRVNGGSNYAARSSTNNVVRVIDGGVLDIPGRLLFVNLGNYCGGGKVVVSNGTIRADSLRISASKTADYGWTEVEIGGTNGTIQVGHLADVQSNVLFRISIPAEGRTCPAIDCSNSGYFLLNRSQEQLQGQRVKLDIDPTWSKSGRDNYADLFFNNPNKHPGLVPEDTTQLTYFMEHCFDPADLINGCTLELLPNAGGIRLVAGTPPGTMVLFR